MNRMVRLFSSALVLISGAFPVSGALHAQTVETVSIGAGYKDQAFYSVETGEVTTAANTNWDVAFQITGFSSSILTNDGNGVVLYQVPNGTPDNWNEPLDTNGMAADWNRWYNSTETWDAGAFNMDSDYNTGNFGWGEYSMITHTVTGTTVFVIKLTDGSFKKIMIDGLAGGVYTFRFADLDGSNETTATLDKKEFAGKHFGYYSIVNNSALDREPVATSWDLTFGKYIAMVAPGMPYAVTGVRHNSGLTAAKVTGVPTSQAVAPSEEAFTTAIATIGYNWKTFDMANNRYVMADSTSYFVRSQTGRLYKLVFTDFGGSATGDMSFSKTELAATSVGTPGNPVAHTAVYPSIATAGEALSLVISLERPATAGDVSVYDITGRLVLARTMQFGDAGLYTLDLSASLPTGMYIVAVGIDGNTSVHRLLVH